MGSSGFKGLLLLLKKRRLGLRENDTESEYFHYLLFGSFDALQIKPFSSWEAQLPSYELDEEASGIYREQNGELKSDIIPYVSSYVLRALQPNKTLLEKTYPDFLHPSWTKPFFALVLINFSHARCQEADHASDLTEWIAKQLNQCPVIQEGQVECGLYESLGYYDEILLLRSSSPKPLHILCKALRGLSSSGVDSISSCYAVLGLQNRDLFDKNQQQRYDEVLANAQNDIDEISVNLQLQPGGTQRPFRDWFPQNSVVREMLNGYKDIAVSVGGTESEQLFKAYFSSGSLNPGTRNLAILNADTHVYTNDTDVSNNLEEITDTSTANYSGQEFWKHEFWNTYLDYVESRQNSGRSLRLATALRQTIIRYKNLVYSDHCFDLQRLLDPVFYALYLNMRRANEYLHENHLCITQFWENYDNAIKDFRDLVGRYISDLSLSDKHFIEDSHLKYPSIGTATKLIFVYQYLAQSFADCMKNGNYYQCLVKSGGRDEIYVTNLFDELWNNAEERESVFTTPDKYDLLVIDMPEKVLYDLPTALFAMLHEVFHVAGDRSRKTRAVFLCDAVSRFASMYLCKGHYKPFLRGPYQYLNKYLNRDELISAAEKGESIFHYSLYLRLFKGLYKKLGPLAENDLLSHSFMNKLEIFCGELLGEDAVDAIWSLEWKSLYCGLKAQEKTIIDRGLYPSRYIMVERIVREWANSDTIQPSEDRRNLSGVVSLLLGNGGEVSDKFFADDFFTVSDMEEKTIIEFFKQCIPTTVELCMDAMCEGFSDIMAISTIGMSWTDYIIALLASRETDLDALLSETEKATLRLGSVLYCAFSICGGLTPSQKDELCSRLKEHSIDSVRDPEYVANRLSNILENARKYYGADGDGNGIMIPVCAYLLISTRLMLPQLGNDYHAVAECVQRLAFEKDALKRKERIMDCWLQLAKE